MSGTDYTKKAINGNSAKGGAGDGVLSVKGTRTVRGLSVWWYELTFLYRSRAEKWLLGVMLAVLALSCIEMAYLASVFEAPAPIIQCSGSG